MIADMLNNVAWTMDHGPIWHPCNTRVPYIYNIYSTPTQQTIYFGDWNYKKAQFTKLQGI